MKVQVTSADTLLVTIAVLVLICVTTLSKVVISHEALVIASLSSTIRGSQLRGWLWCLIPVLYEYVSRRGSRIAIHRPSDRRISTPWTK